MKAERASALIVLRNPLTATHRARIVDLAATSRLPAMYGDREFVDAGGLMSYGVNIADLWVAPQPTSTGFSRVPSRATSPSSSRRSSTS